jgi:hypothetical protein
LLELQDVPNFGEDLGTAQGTIFEFTVEIIPVTLQGLIAVQFIFDNIAEDVNQHDILLVHLRDNFVDFRTLRHPIIPVVCPTQATTGDGEKGVIRQAGIRNLASFAQASRLVAPIGSLSARPV